MTVSLTISSLAHPFWPVNSKVNTQLPLFSDIMNTHSKAPRKYIRGKRDKVWRDTAYYGCSKMWRSLSPQFLLKRFDYVRDALNFVLGLTPGERECTLNCIRLGAYYGKVYPKASTFAEYPGCSKSTFRRTIRKLRDLGLLTIIPRYLQPVRRQISNLLILDKLLLLIFKYLAEHIGHIWPDWFDRYLHMTWPQWWQYLRVEQLKLPLPAAGDCTGL